MLHAVSEALSLVKYITVMEMKNISSFFCKKRYINPSEETEEPPTKKTASGKSNTCIKPSGQGRNENTAYKKTVLKWQKEFSLDLHFKLQEGSEVVDEIWCQTCREFSTERFSSVSKHKLFI